MVSDAEALLGPYRDILRGQGYEGKIENFFDCIDHAHKNEYGLPEKDRQDIRVIMSTADNYVEQRGPLREKFERAKEQIEHVLDRKNKKTLPELLRGLEESKKLETLKKESPQEGESI